MSNTPSRYHTVYQSWQHDPEAFWANAAKAINWASPPATTLDTTQGVYGRWFPGATVNTCYNCVDRHVAAGHGAQAALIYDSPVANAKQTVTYAQLQDEVAALGAVLQGHGVGKGDVVIVYMPMIPEAVVAMLACARIGAVHSVV
ncbi:MAG: AMP-binding protein, partial [Beijerinckiaceae bacterium]